MLMHVPCRLFFEHIVYCRQKLFSSHAVTQVYLTWNGFYSKLFQHVISFAYLVFVDQTAPSLNGILKQTHRRGYNNEALMMHIHLGVIIRLQLFVPAINTPKLYLHECLISDESSTRFQWIPLCLDKAYYLIVMPISNLQQ